MTYQPVMTCLRCDGDPFVPGLCYEVISDKPCEKCGESLREFLWEEVV